LQYKEARERKDEMAYTVYVKVAEMFEIVITSQLA
jgi:hypothetical protein